jgi:hypothetical protein
MNGTTRNRRLKALLCALALCVFGGLGGLMLPVDRATEKVTFLNDEAAEWLTEGLGYMGGAAWDALAPTTGAQEWRCTCYCSCEQSCCTQYKTCASGADRFGERICQDDFTVCVYMCQDMLGDCYRSCKWDLEGWEDFASHEPLSTPLAPEPVKKDSKGILLALFEPISPGC